MTRKNADKTFSFYNQPITNVIPSKELTLKEIYEIIKSNKYKKIVEDIRKLPTKKEQDKLKVTIDYITPAGIFKTRSKSNLKEASGYAPIDIDNIENGLKDLKKKLKSDPYITSLFESPRGEGLKAIIKIPVDSENYEGYVISFYYYLEEKYNIPVESLDAATKDISRACFLSWDEDAYFNNDVKEYTKVRASTSTFKEKLESTATREMPKERYGFLGQKVTNSEVFKSIEQTIKDGNLILYDGSFKPYKIYHSTTAKPDAYSNLKKSTEEITEGIISKVSIFSDKIVYILDNKKHVTIAEGGEVKTVLNNHKEEFEKLIGTKLCFSPQEFIEKKAKKENKDNAKEADEDRSRQEFKAIIKLIRTGKLKEKIFAEMQMYSKWVSAPEQYRELTYNKAVKWVKEKKLEQKESKETKKAHLDDIKEKADTNLISNEQLYELFKEDSKEGVYYIAQQLKKVHHFKTISSTKNQDILIYNDGSYEPKAVDVIRKSVEDILKENSTTHFVNEIVDKIKRLTIVNREEFDNIDNNLICVENGVIDLKEMKLLPHSPDYLFTYKIPVVYDPKAKCPQILKFFKDVLYKDDIETAKEWFGYNLYRKYLIKKALIAVGKKHTAKTTFLNLLAAFLGDKNLAGISLQKLVYDKFAASNLHNKHGNIYDDLSFKDVNDTGAFKIATGGGYITGERKFGDQFRFINYGKITFSTNKIPLIKDVEDDAYYDRWLIIPFDKVFDNDNKNTNRYLLVSLTEKTELSGLLNLALESLKTLLKNGKFSDEATCEDIKLFMETSGSSVASFVNDCLIKDDDGWISKQDLYECYNIFCDKEKQRKFSIEKFGREFLKYANYSISGQKEKINGWKNTALNVSYEGNDTFLKTIYQYYNNSKNSKDKSIFVYYNKMYEFPSFPSSEDPPKVTRARIEYMKKNNPKMSEEAIIQFLKTKEEHNDGKN